MSSKAKETFDRNILESTGNKEHIVKNSVYYDYHYLIELLNDMGEDTIKKYSRELSCNGEGTFKICSSASSSRLTYLFFHDNDNIEYEVELPIKSNNKGISSAHPDAYSKKDRTYYECKCHEIFDSHTSKKLSKSYEEAVYKYFAIEAKIEGDSLMITQKQLDIGKESSSIYNMHFDVKQLLCHLIGIAENKEKDERVKLQYIFFIPDKSESMVNSIKEEVNRIRDKRNKIMNMCDVYKIELCEPWYKKVSEIEDVVYKKLMKDGKG